MNRLFSILLAAVLVFTIGCSRKPDDAKVSSDVQGKFSQDSGLSTKQLTVEASDGVVTLGGFVDNDAQRQTASRQAASVAGVKQVINNLQIGTGSSTSAAGNTPVAPELQPVPFAKPAPARKSRRQNVPEDVAMKSEPAAPGDNTADPSSAAPDSTSTGITSADPAPPSSPPVAAPVPQVLTIQQGVQVSVRLIDAIDSEKNQVGDNFHATTNAALSVEGIEAIPLGADVTGHIVEVKSAGKFAGQSVVVLQLDSVTTNGRSYNLQTDQYRKQGSSRGKNTAEKVGGGAILGGIIGAIAGGGKGAAIGSAAGAGVGGGVQAASKSQQIKLPSETVLNFTLQAPLTVTKLQGQSDGRQKLGAPQ